MKFKLERVDGPCYADILTLLPTDGRGHIKRITGLTRTVVL